MIGKHIGDAVYIQEGDHCVKGVGVILGAGQVVEGLVIGSEYGVVGAVKNADHAGCEEGSHEDIEVSTVGV